MCRWVLFSIICIAATFIAGAASAQLHEQSPTDPPALQPTSPQSDQAATPEPSREKMARVWVNEPSLLRLARDKFGAELTETDAKFFAAVAASEWADLRPGPKVTYNPEDVGSWAKSAVIKSDRINWLCTDPAAVKLVPSRGMWLRGAKIEGKVDLYRCNVPFSIGFTDCLLSNGLNISHGKLEEVNLRNCCSAAVQARAAQVTENVYFLTTVIFGGLDFIDAQVGGDFDCSGALAFHGMTSDDLKKKGVAMNFYDAKISGDLNLNDKFRAYGQVRLIGAQIGRSFDCSTGKFVGGGQNAIDARRAHIGSNAVFNRGFRADGGVVLLRVHAAGDLDCDGGRFIAADGTALDADLADIAGQVKLGAEFHAEGEVRLVNATIGGDVDCDNGHFLNPKGDALSLDGAVISRSLRLGGTNNPANRTIDLDLPAGFVAHGSVRLWGTQVNQDVLASGGHFLAPSREAIVANNLRVASRLILAGIEAEGMVNLASADIEHELDLRCSKFDAKGASNNIAIFASSIHVRGHVFCNQVEGPEPNKLRVNGLTSFQFATIGMHWDLSGAEFINSGGDALDASDCRVGGYVNLDSVEMDGRVSFSRAKIDGMWIIHKTIAAEKLHLDMRFAHVWVIKDERLDDWPPAGQLQLEGLVYDHFDDDSPLDVNDRLEWLRRQYAPIKHNRRAIVQDESKPIAFVVDGASERIQPPSADPAVIPAKFDAPATPAQPVPSSMGVPRMAPPMPMRKLMPITKSAPSPELAAKQRDDEARKQMEAAIEKQKADKADMEGMKAPAHSEAAAEAKDDAKAAAERAQNPDPAVDPAVRRYITQPYTQLAAVYRAIGQDEQANAVLVARAERLGELAPTFSAHALWYRYLGRLIGYGYEPFRAIKIGLAIILTGALIFALGARRNLMAETKLAERVLSSEDESGIVSATYPRFNAFVYSLDVFLPFVDLNQVCYWIPGEKWSKSRKPRNCLMHIGRYSLKWSSLLHGYLWFQTLAGWTLCTLLAAAVTGIVQS